MSDNDHRDNINHDSLLYAEAPAVAASHVVECLATSRGQDSSISKDDTSLSTTTPHLYSYDSGSFSHKPLSPRQQQRLLWEENGGQKNLFFFIKPGTEYLVFSVIVLVFGLLVVLVCTALHERRRREEEGAATRLRFIQNSRLFDGGSLANRAGLTPGLLMTERNLIFKSFFHARKFGYMEQYETTEGDEPNEAAAPRRNKSVSRKDALRSYPPSQDVDYNTENHADNEGTSTSLSPPFLMANALQYIRGRPRQTKKEEDCDEEQEETIQARSKSHTCSICLTDYTAKDRELIHGTQCSHVFHYHCCMQWLKLKDFCPNCRKEMLSPQEYKHAAMDTLGQERVRHLLMRKSWMPPDLPAVIRQRRIATIQPRGPADF